MQGAALGVRDSGAALFAIRIKATAEDGLLRDRQENSGFRGTILAAIAALLKNHAITWTFECPIAPHL